MNFINKIKNGETVFGTLISNPSTAELRGVKTLGLDFVFIDNEHLSLDRSTTSLLVDLYSNAGIPPMVRIPKIDHSMVSVAMDMGFTSVLVPYVEEVQDVIELGSTFRYRPIKGDKLKKLASGEYKLNKDEEDYITKNNKDRGFFINIESQKAIDNLDAILATGYVDGVIVGPNDLTISLGIPAMYDHPLFEEKMLEILAICQKHHVSCGAHFFWTIDAVIKYGKLGMNILLFGGDISLFVDTLSASKNRLFEELNK